MCIHNILHMIVTVHDPVSYTHIEYEGPVYWSMYWFLQKLPMSKTPLFSIYSALFKHFRKPLIWGQPSPPPFRTLPKVSGYNVMRQSLHDAVSRYIIHNRVYNFIYTYSFSVYFCLKIFQHESNWQLLLLVQK